MSKQEEDKLLDAYRRMPPDVGSHFIKMADTVAATFQDPDPPVAEPAKLKLVFTAPSIKTRAVGEDR